MSVYTPILADAAMVTPWRRRTTCTLVAGPSYQVVLGDISALGAFLETNLRIPIGSAAEIHHPEAGIINATIVLIAADGMAVAFDCSEHSVAFALAAIAADMTAA